MSYLKLFEIAKTRAPITLEEWEEFTNSFVLGNAEKGAFLIRPGDEPKFIWIVLKGILRNYGIDDKGKEYTKLFRGPGETLGPFQELLTGKRCQVYIEAVTPVEFVRFPYVNFVKMMDKHKAWERLGRKMAEQSFLQKEKREYDLMHLSAEERYGEFIKMYGDLASKIPQYQVASHLAISPEAFNRMLKKMAST